MTTGIFIHCHSTVYSTYSSAQKFGFTVTVTVQRESLYCNCAVQCSTLNSTLAHSGANFDIFSSRFSGWNIQFTILAIWTTFNRARIDSRTDYESSCNTLTPWIKFRTGFMSLARFGLQFISSKTS